MDIMDIFTFILLLFIALFFLTGLTLTLIEDQTSELVGQKQVPCYDKNNNVINNLTCTQNVTCGVVSKYFDSCELP